MTQERAADLPDVTAWPSNQLKRLTNPSGLQKCRGAQALSRQGTAWGATPDAETIAGRLDAYAPDAFKYQISSKEILG